MLDTLRLGVSENKFGDFEPISGSISAIFTLMASGVLIGHIVEVNKHR